MSRNLTPWLGIVGDFGGHYKTQLFGLEDIDVMQHTFMAGPRFAFREAALAVPYAQFLVGLAIRPPIFVISRGHQRPRNSARSRYRYRSTELCGTV